MRSRETDPARGTIATRFTWLLKGFRVKRVRPWLALFLLGSLVVFWLWPALRAMPGAVPVPPHRLESTVPALNAYILWWNANQLRSGFSSYWDLPIFYPAIGALAFSEPQPITLLAAPLVWSLGPIRAYVLWLGCGLLLNGLLAFWLLRTVSVSVPLAAFGSMMVIGLPIVWHNLDAIQLVGLWPVLWILRQLVRMSQRTSWPDSLSLSAAAVALFCTSAHQALFAAICILPMMGWLMPRAQLGRWGLHIAVSGLLAGLCLAPLAWPMLEIHQQHNFARRAETQQALSATVSQWFSTQTSDALNPGWFCVGLSLTCLGVYLRQDQREAFQPCPAIYAQRRLVSSLITLSIVAGVLSLGWNLRIGQWQIWSTVSAWVPPLDKARSLFRFAYFTQVALVLLAAIGLDNFMRWCLSPIGRWLVPTNWKRLVLAVGGLVAMAGVVWESAPPRPRLASVPLLDPVPSWTLFLRDQLPGTPVVCLPFAQGLSSADLESQTRWMLLATAHRHPLVNGYSGFFPATWYQQLELLAVQPLSLRALEQLQSSGVRLIVVDRRFYDLTGRSVSDDAETSETSAIEIGPYSLHRVYHEPVAIDIWHLQPAF